MPTEVTNGDVPTADQVAADGNNADAIGAGDGSDVAPLPCDPSAWNAALVRHPVEAAPGAGPPPYDEVCEPKLDRKCQTTCDCKFVFVNCNFTAASTTMPWSQWKPGMKKGGVCMDNIKTCAGSVWPKTADKVICMTGLCSVTSPP
ncbi:MAG: hypothetical protein FJ100_22440 [Deltaproteobacteria bacterium]|nr:hypothetical protein [Deltaproteobacteria bacterium]